MLINSIGFLVFFIVVFSLYFFRLKELPKAQNVLLFVASYVFYGIGNWRMLPILIVTTILYYFFGLGISYFKKKESSKLNTLLTAIGIGLGVGILLYFKYMNFFISSFSEMFESLGLHTNLQTFHIILPLGISFFTFRLIGYIIEVNRGNIEPTRNVITFGTYVAFFPCLLSGPIDRPGKFIPQLEKKRTFNYEMAVDGLRQILWGLFKKMVIADNLSKFIDHVWVSHQTLTGSTLLLAAISYSILIYADFSGYSDMAIGVAKILGFEVAKNFNYPYFARSISEFWRKWHMSLTSWLTDYIYIPLGGSRCSQARQFFNTMVVFTLCGLWHGANWTFVLWGFYNGLLFLPLVVRKKKKNFSISVSKGRMLPTFSDFIRMTSIFLLATFGWIFFRAESLSAAFQFVSGIFSKSLFSMPSEGRISIVYIGLLLLIEWIHREKEYPLQFVGKIKKPFLRWIFYLLIILSIALFAGQKSSFIYTQF